VKVEILTLYDFRLIEDVTLVPKYLGVILVMNCVLWSILNFMFLSAFLVKYISFRLFPLVYILYT